jgi:hypothetical protein
MNLNIIEDVETPEARLLSANTVNRTSVSGLEKYDGILEEKPSKKIFSKKNKSFAKMIDNINAKYFTNSPLAIHEHSAFATKKMMELVIGRINEIPFVEQSSSPTSPTFDTTKRIESKYFFGDEENIQRIKFRRYRLTSKSTVNNSEIYPVIKFTFTKVYRDEKDVLDKGFLPGHFIEVQSHVKGQVIVRSYTPIEGKLSKSFSIYVKVYPSGLMSTHLVNSNLTFFFFLKKKKYF